MTRIVLLPRGDEPVRPALVYALSGGVVPDVVDVRERAELRNHLARVQVKDPDHRRVSKRREQTMVLLIERHREICVSVVGSLPCCGDLTRLTIDDRDGIVSRQVCKEARSLGLDLK